MEHANRFGMPILTFIDTPGASAGIEAEHQGQGDRLQSPRDVPAGCSNYLYGDRGGSGGALGIGGRTPVDV